MEFNQDKAIYEQIAEYVCEKVLRGEWKPEERIPSVRELGIRLTVNPNTVMRAYELLERNDIIYSKRGIGFLIAPDSVKNAQALMKEDFMRSVPAFLAKMKLLGLSLEEVMKTKFILLLMLVGGAWSLSAQTVRGVVKEAETGTGIPFANVVLVNAADSTQVMGMASGDSGEFAFKKLPQGRYFVQAAVLGYHRSNSETFTVGGKQNNDILLEPIVMTSQAVQMKQVTVRAKRPMIEMKPGKITMNVAESLILQNENAFEMLKKFPGVTVDKDDNISLNGQSGVLVTIDDRPTHLDGTNLANYLRSISSESISQIEVMNNPSSKYDAEGTGGIINFKTNKKQKAGFSGTLSAGSKLQNRAMSGLQTPLYAGFDGSLNLNYRSEKVTVYADVSVFEGRQGLYMYEESRYSDGSRDIINELKNEQYAKNNYSDFFGFFGKGGFDIYPTRQDVLSLTYRGHYFSDGQSIGTMINRHYLPGGDSVYSSYTQKADGGFNGGNHTVNFNYEHTFDTVFERKLTADFEWMNASQDIYANFGLNTYLGDAYTGGTLIGSNPYTSHQPLASNIYSLKLDYEHPFNDRSSIEAGIKFSYVNNNSRNNYHDMSDTVRDHFIYDEMIAAAYVVWNYTFKTQTQLQVGLRGEFTHVKGNNTGMDSVFTKNYGRPFPNITLTQPIDPKNTLSLSYRYRLSRPPYQSLNPFYMRQGAQQYKGGNADLMPEYSHNIDLSYSYNYKLFVTAGYRHIDDNMVRVNYFDAMHNAYITEGNLGKVDFASLNISTNLTFYKIWRLMINVHGSCGVNDMSYESPYGSGIQKVHNLVFNSGYWVNTEVDAHKNLTVGLWSWGQLPYRDGFSRSIGYYGAGIELKANFLNKSLTLSAGLDYDFVPWTRVNEYPATDGGLSTVSNGIYDDDRLSGSLRISWRFGNNKMMNRATRHIEQSEESSRVSSGGTGGGR